jgi:hypothetical protein
MILCATNPAGKIRFFTQTWVSEENERMIINQEGKVGIGTSEPSELLSVNGVVESSQGGFKFPDGSVQSTAAQNTPELWTQVSGGIALDHGKVGIGTSEPTEQLEVNGNILVSQDNAIILTSPNGTKFRVMVDDNGNLVTEESTSVQNVSFTSNVKIYPNPSYNTITIDINESISKSVDLEIYAIDGKMIYMKNYKSKSFNVNINELARGTYLVKLKDSNGNLISTEKIIKK